MSMILEQQSIPGLVQSNGTSLNVQVSGHTNYSFQIRLPEEPANPPEFHADRFMIELDRNEIELGRCRLLAMNGSPSTDYTVLLLDGIVDVVDLIGKKRLTVYDTGLFNLELILNQKEKVSASFKEYSSNLTFELNVYKQFFDNLDRLYLREPGPVQAHLQQMTIDREGQAFLAFFDLKVQELTEHANRHSKDENEAHGFFFRRQVWDFILHSAFMVRTNLKPRGYAGDYEMMQMIYDNDVVGYTIFSQLLNSYPLRIAAAQAVRNRRTMMAETLRSEVESHNGSGFRAMSVACGPAEEIGEAFSGCSTPPSIHFTLLDQDTEALRAATNGIQQLEAEKGWPMSVHYINDSVRSMLRIPDLANEWGQYDLVYSMGLFDYLTPPVARAVLTRLYQLVRPGGRLLVGNFHSSYRDRVFMEYWLDWVLFHRTEEEMLELAAMLPGESRIFFEETGTQMFLEVRAPDHSGV